MINMRIVQVSPSRSDFLDGTPAGVRAMVERCWYERASPLARPLLREFPCPGSASSAISPVAILAILTAFPITSAGRFSPFGPTGISRPLSWKVSRGYTIRPSLDQGLDFKLRHYRVPELNRRGTGSPRSRTANCSRNGHATREMEHATRPETVRSAASPVAHATSAVETGTTGVPKMAGASRADGPITLPDRAISLPSPAPGHRPEHAKRRAAPVKDGMFDGAGHMQGKERNEQMA